VSSGVILNRSRQVPAEETTAFGAIAERFRRAGDLERAIALCREGLHRYPDHLSARVTLGWALLDQGKYDDARDELERVLKRAPDNLAAIRGLAQLHEHRHVDEVGDVDAHGDWLTHDDTAEIVAHEATEYIPPSAAAGTAITDEDLELEFGDIVAGTALAPVSVNGDDFPVEEDLTSGVAGNLDAFLAEEPPADEAAPPPDAMAAEPLVVDEDAFSTVEEDPGPIALDVSAPDDVLNVYRNAMPLPTYDENGAPVTLTFDPEPGPRHTSPLDLAFAREEAAVDGSNLKLETLEGILRHVRARQASPDLAWRDA